MHYVNIRPIKISSKKKMKKLVSTNIRTLISISVLSAFKICAFILPNLILTTRNLASAQKYYSRINHKNTHSTYNYHLN